MLRRVWPVVAAAAAGLVLGGSVVAVAQPNDPCDAKYTANTVRALKDYEACRLDRIEGKVDALGKATPSPSTTPTPSPTVAPSSSATPTPQPSPVGYPDASTTGVPQGTTLTKVGPGGKLSGPGWSYDSRGWVRANAGAVLDGLDIPFNVDVTGDNVTIRNSRITLGGESFGVSIRHARGTLIEDTEITWDGKARLLVAVKDIYGDSTGTVVRRADISKVSTGVQMDGGLIEESYIHDLLKTGDDHLNGTTSNGGTGQLTIRHNTILNSYSQTDAVSLFQDFGTQKNRLIENNLLAGGGYAIYGGEGTKGATSNIKIRNNQISTRFFANGGFYGPIAHFTPTDSGNEATGNVWADGPKKGQLAF